MTSQVRPTIRTAITIPEQAWPQFEQMLAEFTSKAAAQQSNNAPASAEEPDDAAESAAQ